MASSLTSVVSALQRKQVALHWQASKHLNPECTLLSPVWKTTQAVVQMIIMPHRTNATGLPVLTGVPQQCCSQLYMPA